MSDNQAGDGSQSSGWADAPWQASSLANSSLDDNTPGQAATAAPNPFSREGSDLSAEVGSPVPPPAEPPAPTAMAAPTPLAPTPTPTPSAPEAPVGWSGYPQVAAEQPAPPYGQPPQPYAPAPGFDPQPTAPYGPADQQGYGQPPAAPYGDHPAYGSVNPYEQTPAPYQPSYGGYTPYGLVPVNHPQATQSLIFGILGLVLGLSCGVGALFGIAGIVTGRKVRQAIDADPQRYTGRGMASAAIGLSIGGFVVLGLWIVFIALGLAFGS